MKDVGEAIASVIILGTGLSITISAVASGRLFSLGSGACQQGTSGDCLLLAILVVWGLAATIVGSAYVVFRIWLNPRIPVLRPSSWNCEMLLCNCPASVDIGLAPCLATVASVRE